MRRLSLVFWIPSNPMMTTAETTTRVSPRSSSRTAGLSITAPNATGSGTPAAPPRNRGSRHNKASTPKEITTANPAPSAASETGMGRSARDPTP